MLGVSILGGCGKKEECPNLKVEETRSGRGSGNESDKTFGTGYEGGWEMGKFGNRVPPESQRTYDDPNQIGYSPELYYTVIHTDKYGDVMIQFDDETGGRSIGLPQGENDPQPGKWSMRKCMMSVDGKINKSLNQLLKELEQGDAIADFFNK